MKIANEPKPRIEKIVITGEAGQGNLLLGRLLAYCGMKMGSQVSFLPSFGFEEGEGQSSATIILSEKEIGSPLVYIPDVLISSNQAGFDHWLPKVKAGGLVLLNCDLIQKNFGRDDVRSIAVPATRLAEEAGNPAVANMVLCGAYIGLSDFVHLSDLLSNIENFFRDLRHFGLEKFNQSALQAGYDFIHEKKYMHARLVDSVLRPID